MSKPTALSYLAGRVATLEGSLTSVFSFKGNVATTDDLPNDGNSAGDAYIVQFDDSFQVWSGTAWVSGGSIRGTDGTNGVNGTNGADGADGVGISTTSYNAETGDLTITLTDTTEHVYNVKGDTGADGVGISTTSYNAETGDLTITLTDTTEHVYNVKGDTGADGAAGKDGLNGTDGVDGVVDYVVRVSGDSLVADAITDAWEDYIGVLADVASNTDLELPENSGGTTRVDGKMLRFFCNSPSNDAHHYSVKEIGGSTLFQIHGQQAYTMIWRSATSDWIVVPGIINPKSAPLPT